MQKKKNVCEGSCDQNMTLSTVSFDLLILRQPNLVQSIMQEDWFAVFKFRVTLRAHLIRYDCVYHICRTVDLFATKFD